MLDRARAAAYAHHEAVTVLAALGLLVTAAIVLHPGLAFAGDGDYGKAFGDWIREQIKELWLAGLCIAALSLFAPKMRTPTALIVLAVAIFVSGTFVFAGNTIKEGVTDLANRIQKAS